MELHKPICVLFLPHPVFLRAVDSITMPMDLTVVSGIAKKTMVPIAKIVSDSPIGRSATIVGVRYSRTLVDGEIVARHGEFLTDRSLLWEWPEEGKERRGSFMPAHVVTVDTDTEQKLISSSGDISEVSALLDMPEKVRARFEVPPPVDIRSLQQTVEQALRDIGFAGPVEAAIDDDGVIRVSAIPDAHEPFGVAVHPASPVRMAPQFSERVVERMVANHRWIFGPDDYARRAR